MKYQVTHTNTDSNARAGIIITDHGQILTPIFMPVGTCGSVKGVHFKELIEQVQAQIILGNTYHLYLRPGLDTLERAGGLHKFIGWDRPILTDSGGFQVFSLTGIRKLTDEGCEFRSHIDGSKHFFTPENVMETQRSIGADIMMAFDECPPGQSSYEYAKKSLQLTERWLERCIKHFKQTQPRYDHSQTLFPIVQGCTYKDLRQEAAKRIADLDVEGTMNMRNKKWEHDFTPIDPTGCYVDQIYTKAYLHHLFKAGELLAMQIASIHNLAFYLRLVTDARNHIIQGDFHQWKTAIVNQLSQRR